MKAFCFFYFLVWRKVFEANANGKIDHVIWSRKEIVVFSAGWQRVQSFEYLHGAAGWDFGLFTQDPSRAAKLAIQFV